MNIGMKIAFMQMNDPTKCSRPSRSFNMRPVTFGNQ
jgi:hypothetical protein